jgi:glycosyltransferase involved in cell wall biosynthesis
MRVLLISNTYPPGDISGVGVLVAELAAELRRQGHEATVLTRRPGGAGPRVAGVPGPKVLFPVVAALRFLSLAKQPFDIVHVHESDGVFVALAVRVARRLGLPQGRPRLVATLHVSYVAERRAVRPVRADGEVVSRPTAGERLFAWVRAPLHASLGRWTARLADAVVALSAAAAGELGRDYGARVAAVIPNGVPLPPTAPARRDAPDAGGGVVLFLGRLRTRKAVAVLLVALARVRRQAPGARLVVVGDGEQRRALEAQVRALGLADAVELAGALGRAEAQHWLARADVLCLPSTYEGFPMVILEAMAAGLPVVATAVAGVPKAVRPGETGLLVEPEDATGLAVALLAVLGDPARARAMGEAGRRLVADRFTIAHATAAYVDLWRRLVAADGGVIASAADDRVSPPVRRPPTT